MLDHAIHKIGCVTEHDVLPRSLEFWYIQTICVEVIRFDVLFEMAFDHPLHCQKIIPSILKKIRFLSGLQLLANMRDHLRSTATKRMHRAGKFNSVQTTKNIAQFKIRYIETVPFLHGPSISCSMLGSVTFPV